MKCVVALIVVDDQLQDDVYAPAPNVASVHEWLKWLEVWGSKASVHVSEQEVERIERVLEGGR